MIIYHYSDKTFELIGESIADESPEDAGVFLVPRSATSVEPPSFNQNQVPFFDANNESWDLVDDLRGTEFWLDDRSHHVIKDINTQLPAGALLVEPPLPVSAVVGAKKSELIAAQRAVQISGFTSSALGTEHTYPSDNETQSDYIGIKEAAIDISVRCKDASGFWSRRLHTAGQFALVFASGLLTKHGQRVVLDDLIDSVELIAADTNLTLEQQTDQINAIGWS